MKPLLSMLALAMLVVAAPCSKAQEAGGWSQGAYARVRLVNAGSPQEGIWRAGLEIDLQDGWKTYWRSPGETGVPPVFDWSASQGVSSIELRWPVPHRFQDSGLETVGYKTDVILPLEIRGDKSGAPPRLELMLSYAVCSDICVPEEARLTLDLSQPTRPFERMAVEEALAAVPDRASEAQHVRAAQLGSGDGAPLRLVLNGPAPQEIFLEGPPDWYLPAPQLREGSGGTQYEITLSGIPPKTDPAGAKLTVTLVYPDGAVEETVRIARP